MIYLKNGKMHSKMKLKSFRGIIVSFAQLHQSRRVSTNFNIVQVAHKSLGGIDLDFV